MGIIRMMSKGFCCLVSAASAVLHIINAVVWLSFLQTAGEDFQVSVLEPLL